MMAGIAGLSLLTIRRKMRSALEFLIPAGCSGLLDRKAHAERSPDWRGHWPRV